MKLKKSHPNTWFNKVFVDQGKPLVKKYADNWNMAVCWQWHIFLNVKKGREGKG